MAWFKVDDGFHGHPKVLDLSLAAVGLWSLAGSWSAKYLTDGFVPEKTLHRLGASRAEADELVTAGLWLTVPGGWRFKDWEHYQPVKEEVEAEREAARERMKKVRAAKKGVPKNADSGSPELPSNEDRSSEEVRIAPSLPIPVPIPSPVSSSEVPIVPFRQDVDSLLNLLDEEIRANGSKVPERTVKNADAMRLLIDKDGRTPEQIAAAIRWCQSDEFWRSNILSAVKLREKYDQLRLKAQQSRASRGPKSDMERVAAILSLTEQTAAQWEIE